MTEIFTIILMVICVAIISTGTIRKKKYKNEVIKKYSNMDETGEFNSIYEQIMNENLNELKKQRIIRALKNIAFTIIMILTFTIPFMLVAIFEVSKFLAIISGIILFIITAFVYPQDLKIKNDIIGMLLKNINNNIRYNDLNEKYEEQENILEDLYLKAGFRDRTKSFQDAFEEGRESNKKKVSDYIEYRLEDGTIAKLSDISLKYEIRHNKLKYIEEIFEGIIVKIENRKMIENNILIEIDKINKERDFSLKYQELDEPFEKIFDLRVTDVEDAIVIMDEKVKQELLNLYYEYGIMFEIALKETNIYIRFYTGDLFEIERKSIKQMKKTLCRDYYMFKDILVMISRLNTILKQDNIISIRQGY